MQYALLTARQSCRACGFQWPACVQAAAAHPPCSRQAEQCQLQLTIQALHPSSTTQQLCCPPGVHCVTHPLGGLLSAC